MMQGSGQASTLVKVFIRTRDKKARGVLLSRQISGNKLKKIAADKTHIPLESLSLFNQGQEIQQEAQLQDNNIIHAIDLRNVNVESIHLYVKLLDQKAAREKYAVNTSTLIKDFINDNLLRLYEVNMDDIFLVYTGKQVDIQKNFREELIENESEVICVKVKNIQQKNKDQDQIHQKASHQATHAQGQKKQEFDDKTIRIATKVAKINADSTAHVLKSGKPDQQEQVEVLQEQTEVIVSMKEVEEEEKISQNVAPLHQANVETEKQEDGLHEIVTENQVADVVQHEQIAEPVQSHAVLHSPAPVVEQNGHPQINLEQPNTIDFHAEAVNNEQEQSKVVLELKDAQLEEQIGKIPQLNEARQLPIGERQVEKEENAQISLQEPNPATQIQEPAVVEEAKHQGVIKEESLVPQHPAQNETTPALHSFEQEDTPITQARVEHSESPHVAAEQQVIQKVESKPVEEQALTHSHEIEIEEKTSLPVQISEEAAPHEIVPVQNANLESDKQEQVKLESTDDANTHQTHPKEQTPPSLNSDQIQLNAEHQTDSHQTHQTKEKLEAIPQPIQNAGQLSHDGRGKQEAEASQEPYTENMHHEGIIVENAPTTLENAQLKEQKQETAHQAQSEEPVAYQHEEPLKVEEKHPQDAVVTEHEPVPALENAVEHVSSQKDNPSQEATEKTQEIVHQKEDIIHENIPIQEEPVDPSTQGLNAPQDNPVQNVEVEKTEHQQSEEVLHQNTVSLPVEDVEPIHQQATEKHEVTVAPHVEAPIEEEVKQAPTLQAVYHEVVEEVRQQVHQRVTETVQFQVTQAPIVVEQHEVEAPISVQSHPVVDTEPLAIHSQNKAEVVSGDENSLKHTQQHLKINEPEVVAEKTEHAQQVDAPLLKSEVHEEKEQEAVQQHTIPNQTYDQHQQSRLDQQPNPTKTEQKDITPVLETQTEQAIPISLQQHNEPADHKQAEPIVQQDIAAHKETHEDHGDSSEIRVALQQHAQEEAIVVAKIEECPPIQVVEYHSEGHVPIEEHISNTPYIEQHEQPVHKQEEHHIDNVHQVQAATQQIIQADHRQAFQVLSNIDNVLYAAQTQRPATDILGPIEWLQPGLQASTDNVPVLETTVDNIPVDNVEVIQPRQVDHTQPAVELAQESNQPLQEETHNIQIIPHQQETTRSPAILANTQQTPAETQAHFGQYLEEKIRVLEAQVDHQEKLVIPQGTRHFDIDYAQHREVHIQAVGAGIPTEESAAVQNSEEHVAEDKDLAETGHQWEVKDQSAPIALEQIHQKHQNTTTHQNEPVADEKNEQQSHYIELTEEPATKQVYFQEILHQEPVVSLETDVEPRSAEIVYEHHEHQPTLIETSPVLETATIEVPQAATDHHQETTQKLQSRPNEHKQQQIAVKAQEPKQAEINHEAETHHEHTEIQRPIHTEAEAVTINQQQWVQETANQHEIKEEEAAPQVQQSAHQQTHENNAEQPAEAPVQLQAIAHQPIPETKEVVTEETCHEVKPAVTIQEVHAEPVKAEPELVTQAEIAPQVHQDQYSQLPYVSSSQLPLSQNTSSSFGNASHNNLEIIAHLKMEAPFQSTQKGVAFESLAVKSPHSTTNQCLIYQQQIIHKSGNQQISIVKAEEAPEENTYQHAAPIPEERAEPSLLENINHEALSTLSASHPTD